MKLVVDANVAVRTCAGPDGFAILGKARLYAPPLMWSEFFSLVREAQWREEITAQHANTMLDHLASSPIKRRAPRKLHREAWRVAEELGLAKTYDAEYVALARLLRCRMVTFDGRRLPVHI